MKNWWHRVGSPGYSWHLGSLQLLSIQGNPFPPSESASLSEAQSISQKEAKVSRYLLSLHCSWDLGMWLRIHPSDPPTPETGEEAGIRQNALGNHSGNCWSRYMQISLLVNTVLKALLRPKGHWSQECELPSVCLAAIMAPSASFVLWFGGRLLTPWTLSPDPTPAWRF